MKRMTGESKHNPSQYAFFITNANAFFRCLA